MTRLRFATLTRGCLRIRVKKFMISGLGWWRTGQASRLVWPPTSRNESGAAGQHKKVLWRLKLSVVVVRHKLLQSLWLWVMVARKRWARQKKSARSSKCGGVQWKELWQDDDAMMGSELLSPPKSHFESRTSDLLFLNNIHSKKIQQLLRLALHLDTQHFFTSGNPLPVIDRWVDSLHRSLFFVIGFTLLIIWSIAGPLSYTSSQFRNFFFWSDLFWSLMSSWDVSCSSWTFFLCLSGEDQKSDIKNGYCATGVDSTTVGLGSSEADRRRSAQRCRE